MWRIVSVIMVAVLLLTSMLTLVDANLWIKHSGNPVLDPGPSGSWDARGPSDPFVLKDNGVYMMWYNSEYYVGGQDYIGFANSTDGKNWTKYPENPVISPGTGWEQGRVYYMCVIKENGVYKMWYTGRQGVGTGRSRIGFANSTDGVNWTKYDGNPVLDVGSSGEWDADLVTSPYVIKDGEVYKMWYNGRDSSGRNRIGYATSIDGLNWTKFSNNPIIDTGSPGEYDSNAVNKPTVIIENGIYHIWYTGIKDNPQRTHSIGYATSTNGTDWTKWFDNPVLESNSTNPWESKDVSVGQVIREDDLFKMWYNCRGSDLISHIGYAESIRIPDINVCSLTTSKTGCLPVPTIGQGYTTELNMTIENQGNYAEIFNVTAYANTTMIDRLTDIPILGNSTTITFTWNTTDFPKGNYTLSAYVTPINGEIDLDDNNFTNGWILVTIAGDVTSVVPGIPDGIVNMRDIGAICDMFMTTPSDPEWNPNRDINGDGVVNMRDIGIACGNFMKT